MLESVRVEVEKPRPVTAASIAAMREVAGLYIGSAMVFQANPMGTVGSGRWVAGTKWYLLSPDGKTQSGYKLPQAPDGDITRFDYDAARRADPGFGGTYFVEGNQITLKLGNEKVVADRTPKGMAIRGTSYEKMDLNQKKQH